MSGNLAKRALIIPLRSFFAVQTSEERPQGSDERTVQGMRLYLGALAKRR